MDPVVIAVSSAMPFNGRSSDDMQGQYSHGGRRDLELWSNENTETLVNLVKENYSRLAAKDEKSAEVWRDVTQGMIPSMPYITVKQVNSKWKNLRKQFQKYEQNKRALNKARIKRPPCYDLLRSFLTDRHTVNIIEELGDDDDAWPQTHQKAMSPISHFLENGGSSQASRHGNYVDDCPEGYHRRRRQRFHPMYSPPFARRLESFLQEIVSEVKRNNELLERCLDQNQDAMQKNSENQFELCQLLKERNDILKSLRN